MNEILKGLATQAGITFSKDFVYTDYSSENGHSFNSKNLTEFAQLIIKAVLDDPKIYILNKKSNTEPESTFEIHGWTADLRLAQQWRDSDSRHESRNFTDIYFIKHITSL